MTRRPKTWHGYYPCVTKFRRQPKGRRAKSGQWWRREPATLSDYLHRIIIDEAADPIPMDVLQRCEPRMTGGTKIEIGVDLAREGTDVTVFRLPDGTKFLASPAGRDTSRTDTTLMEALRRSNEP